MTHNKTSTLLTLGVFSGIFHYDLSDYFMFDINYVG